MQLKNSTKHGLTLIEVVVATTIFTIAFGAILVAKVKSRQAGESALIKFIAVHYQQALLESIQSYPYDEPSYDYDDPSQVFSQHDTTFAAYNTSESGIYNSGGSLVETLDEEYLTIKSYRSDLPASPTPDTPFELDSNLQPNSRLIGMEDEDHSGKIGFGPSTGKFQITQDQLDANIFEGKELSKYYFADDVDDFDGYKEKREILPGVIISYEVSIMPVYINKENYDVEYTDSGGSVVSKEITQEPFDIMQPIAVGDFPDGLTFGDSPNPTLELMTQGLAYYRQALFKKVTIKSTWEYPVGSGNIKTIVLDGGSINASKNV